MATQTSSPTYPSDVTDAEWEYLQVLLPAPRNDTAAGGRPLAWPVRSIVNAIVYVVRTGCSWRQLPHDFPPWQSVYRYFRTWSADGTLDEVHDALRTQLRHADARAAEPSAGIIDSQSVRAADTVGAGHRGFDAGKKVNGRKRHLVVDTLGLLLMVLVSTAGLQDRDGGRRLLARLVPFQRRLRLIFADGGYAGRLVTWAKTALDLVVQIVSKPAGQPGFAVLPRRWVVERTLAWLVRCRRIARDYERLPDHSEAMIKWAMIGLMSRRLARRKYHTPPAYNW
jgi:transposase